jgi:acetolactate synthase-1/2/3 large subunit
MAAGFAMATGRGQAVIVHVDAGTANSAMAMHNARRGRLPLLLMAGKAPYTVRGELPGSRDNYVHFIQEPFDQSGIMRPYVKWEWTLPSGIMTKETLRRAHTVAHSDPMGPVYLMLPRETLTQTWDEAAMRAFPAERYGAVRSGVADSTSVAALAEKLISAKHPVMVTSYAGRNLEAPALIEELARLTGIRVFEASPLYLNISRASPCFAGMMPDVASADVGLLVDVDVPWIPKHTKENPGTWWAHVDVDVVKECFPIWGFASNARLQGDSVLILKQLLEAVKAKATPALREAAAKRMVAIARESAERRANLAKQAAHKGERGAINPHYLCAEVSKALGDDSIVVNEGIRNGPVINAQVMRTSPGSSIGFAGGGLGSSSGTSLGVKLERPEAMVVQMVGDGGFYFGNPSSVYAVSKQYRLPIFTVLFDNSGWSAVKEATLRVYPEGEAKATNEFNALLAPEIEFAKICEAAGGYGEKVTEPETVPAAIQRCLKEVRSGRSALMHVRIPVL